MCFSLAGINVQLDEDGGRILQCDNRGGGTVILRPIRFQCVGVWMSTGLPCTYRHSRPHAAYAQFPLTLEPPRILHDYTAAASSIAYRVELGYNVMKGTEYFVLL